MTGHDPLERFTVRWSEWARRGGDLDAAQLARRLAVGRRESPKHPLRWAILVAAGAAAVCVIALLAPVPPSPPAALVRPAESEVVVVVTASGETVHLLLDGRVTDGHGGDR